MSALENLPDIDNGLLRFLTCGSVDDGKSTLIGRLLFDTKTILADTLNAIEKTSAKRGMSAVDLSLLTDGLQAEREQGITIDVAYRYFSTGRRKYIIADAPGHEQYTRNMVTAASTANLAIILIDARKGVLTQTRRHSYLASLVGIPHLRGRGQQDGPRRLRPGGLRAHQGRLPRLRRQARHRGRALHPDLGAGRRHDRRPRRAPVLVRRPDAARHPRERPRRPHRAGRGLPLPGAVRVPPAGLRQPRAARLPRLHGPGRIRRDRRRRRGHRAALGRHQPGEGRSSSAASAWRARSTSSR